MAYDGAFSAEEVGTRAGSPTGGAVPGRSGPAPERVTLTPYDRAFLESPPNYEEGGSLSPSEPLPAPVPAPSPSRRARSRALFIAIAGSALAVLGLAALRYLGHLLLGG
jgi:hypothetical protein